MWNKIVNPKNGRKVNLNSKIGKNILQNYLYFLQKGGVSEQKMPRPMVELIRITEPHRLDKFIMGFNNKSILKIIGDKAKRLNELLSKTSVDVIKHLGLNRKELLMLADKSTELKGGSWIDMIPASCLLLVAGVYLCASIPRRRHFPQSNKEIYYYDNDFNHYEGNTLCPLIRFNWVDATGNAIDDENNINYTLDWRRINHRDYDNQFLQLFDPDSNARRLADFIKEQTNSTAYDPRSGKNVIIGMQMVSFYDHVIGAASDANVDGFVFDWDRTLQVTEGMFHQNVRDWENNLRLSYEETIDALGEYHAGGNERREKLRNMFNAIGDKPVTIITASDAILGRGRDVYTAILRNWGCINVAGMYFSINKYRTMSTKMNQYC